MCGGGLGGEVQRVHTFLYALPMDYAEISGMNVACVPSAMNTLGTYYAASRALVGVARVIKNGFFLTSLLIDVFVIPIHEPCHPRHNYSPFYLSTLTRLHCRLPRGAVPRVPYAGSSRHQSIGILIRSSRIE